MAVLILSIETSCDETSAAVVTDGTSTSLGTRPEVLSNVIASQTEFHKKYGGIVPEIASRKHIEVINLIIKEAMEKATKGFEDINAAAVTCGPGLVGSLLVGVCAAKAIAYSLNIPLIGVNHLEGHIYANFLSPSTPPPFPFICLMVSGGHTMIVEVKDHGKYKILGQTRDDAAGEAFDKVARLLKLGFPGGPIIDKLAKEGNPHAVEFKRPMIEDEFKYDFSFSGIKTAVVNLVHRPSSIVPRIPDIVASFQQAVVDVLVEKTIKAAKNKNINTICLAGGVSANSLLRSQMLKQGEEAGLSVIIPPFEYTTDNAAMIGCAAYYKFINNKFSDLSLKPSAILKL